MATMDSASGTSQGGALISALIEHVGGLEGIMAKFNGSGLTEHIRSWISTGKNLPISAEQIQKVFGEETLGKVASKAGVTVTTLVTHLSASLPNVIDKLSPTGQLPQDGPVKGVLSMIQKFMGQNKSEAPRA